MKNHWKTINWISSVIIFILYSFDVISSVLFLTLACLFWISSIAEDIYNKGTSLKVLIITNIIAIFGIFTMFFNLHLGLIIVILSMLVPLFIDKK